MSGTDHRWEIGHGRGQDVRIPFGRADRRQVAHGHNEVIIRVFSPTGGKGGLYRELHYATRDGHVVAKDQDGREVKGVHAIHRLAEDWHMANATDSRSKSETECVQIVLSMPKGNDREKVEQAARAWAGRSLTNHDWIMARHDDKEHPHVHILLRAVGNDGRRFSAGTGTFKRWREDFARELRDRGIEATATRYERGRDKPERSAPEAWMMETGGMEGMSAKQRQSAERSFAEWSVEKPDLARKYGLDDYVEYVQEKWSDRSSRSR